MEALIRTFLPPKPPEAPPLEEQEVETAAAAAVGSAAAVAVSLSDGGHKNGDGGTAAQSSDMSGGERGSHSVPQRRQNSSKMSGGSGSGSGGGSSSGGDGTTLSSDGNSNGTAASDIHDADSGAFWDEAGAGGAGLVMSSPLDLEPIITPWSSGSPSAATTPASVATALATVASSPSAAARAPVTTGAGVANGSLFSVGHGTTSSRFAGGPGAAATAATAATTMGGNGDDRLWLVYEGPSAAGKGVISRVNAPDPYWLGHASPGAVCPHAHSMEFYSAFESANLLRAVQVCVFVRARVRIVFEDCQPVGRSDDM